MDRRPPYSNNVIAMRYRRNAGDAAPAPQPSSGASPWSFLALLAVGYGVFEGMKYMAGTHREPVMMPGARLMREPSRIARHNPGPDVRKWSARDRIAIYAPIADKADREAWQAPTRMSDYEKALGHERAYHALSDLAKAYADSGNDVKASELRTLGKSHMKAYAELFSRR